MANPDAAIRAQGKSGKSCGHPRALDRERHSGRRLLRSHRGFERHDRQPPLDIIDPAAEPSRRGDICAVSSRYRYRGAGTACRHRADEVARRPRRACRREPIGGESVDRGVRQGESPRGSGSAILVGGGCLAQHGGADRLHARCGVDSYFLSFSAGAATDFAGGCAGAPIPIRSMAMRQRWCFSRSISQ